MLTIRLYENARGRCPVTDFYSAIEKTGGKNAKIQIQQYHLKIGLLEKLGTWQTSEDAVKHLQGKVWELRPGKNRILFFQWNDAYILLHAFLKTTNQTPPEEIEKAEKEIDDWINQHGH